MALTLASMMPGREGAGLRDEPAGDRHRPWNAGSSVGLAPVASASGLNKMLRDCFAASAALAVGMSFLVSCPVERSAISVGSTRASSPDLGVGVQQGAGADPQHRLRGRHVRLGAVNPDQPRCIPLVTGAAHVSCSDVSGGLIRLRECVPGPSVRQRYNGTGDEARLELPVTADGFYRVRTGGGWQ
jgi:hypothetical protein